MAIKDLSVVGNAVTGTANARAATLVFDGKSSIIKFSDLFYEGQVVQFEQMDVSGYDVDANGRFYTWRTKKPIVFTISLFPGSRSDMSLANTVLSCISASGKSIEIKNASLTYSSGYTMSFSDGTLAGWLPGVNASGDNRQGAKTYRFAFSDMAISKGNQSGGGGQ